MAGPGDNEENAERLRASNELNIIQLIRQSGSRVFSPGLGNLSTKNRLRDRFFGEKSRQVTGQRFPGPNLRQESRTGFKTETGL